MNTLSNDNPMPGELTPEQKFKLRVIQDQVRGLSLEQAQDYVVEVFRQMMVKDNLVKELLRNG